MTIRAAALLPLAAALAGAWGCAGDGSRIVEETLGGPRLRPTLASIQRNIFTPICTDCHFPGGPGPMPLDSEQASFDNLVGVPSIEVLLLRVDPGRPDDSYLVLKVENAPGIVLDRMPPPPQPMLTAEEIAAIRQWVLDGAPR